MNEKSNRGFTLVELLVVIAIIGVLISMTLPALMASRETGRRNMCRANMAQIALALQNYENAFEMFPAGVVNPDGPVRNEAKGLDQGWLIPVLPYLDEQNVYEHIDQSQSVYAPENAAARDYWPPVLICPSESNDVPGTSSYAGCHHDVEAPIAADNAGMLFLNSHIRREDVTDGLARYDPHRREADAPGRSRLDVGHQGHAAQHRFVAKCAERARGAASRGCRLSGRGACRRSG